MTIILSLGKLGVALFATQTNQTINMAVMAVADGIFDDTNL